LKFGHHGANHPVIDLRTGKVEITSQNHNFAVRFPTDRPQHGQGMPIVETPFGRVQLSHTSLNDGSVEGMVFLDHPVFSVQYHPEASPGPHDSTYLFDEFTALMEKQHA
jgi:Carbamoylphosphate synthase small subunit